MTYYIVAFVQLYDKSLFMVCFLTEYSKVRKKDDKEERETSRSSQRKVKNKGL